MLIYQDNHNKKNSVYLCDRCLKKLKRDKDEIYSIYVKKINETNPMKKWDLCKDDYVLLCDGMEWKRK